MLLADDTALRDVDEALAIAERSSEDFALGTARWALGVALVHRESPAERERGLAVLGQVRDMCLRGRFYLFMLPVLDVWGARERARCGDRDGAIPALRLWSGNQHEVWVAVTRCLRVQWKRIRRVELSRFLNPHPTRLTCFTSLL